ncbi:threonine/serine exporter [Macrococcus bovicus]|uniref:Threonine/serine exporter n=1 Tax=Macrococcus bovicus TaxID=69968 RepID=A0A4R6C0E3_9STAP|nr:threonine/serine exporter [Macrococcus bovicus]
MELNINKHEEYLKDVIILAGEILLESGAGGYRIEQTMNQIARHFGYADCNSFVTNTVINFSLHDLTYPRVKRVTARNTNLIKVSRVNAVAHQITSDQLTVEEALEKLKVIQDQSESYPAHYKAVASALVGLSFLYLQSGDMQNIATAMIAAAAGFFVKERVASIVQSLFIPEFIGALLIAFIVIAMNHGLTDPELSVTLIAAVMPIVPGVLITNSLQDLLAGNLMMALTKGLEAAVTSFAIGQV